MVGGFAVNLNGFVRSTADADIWLEDTLDNRKKFRAVLKSIGVGDYEEIETTQLIPGWSSIMLNSGFELDVMTFMKGFSAERFVECYEIAPAVDLNGIPLRFLHINNLIEEKRALGRPRDLIDIMELEKIRDGK